MNAFSIVALIVAAISPLLLTGRFSESLQSYRVLKKESDPLASRFGKWTVVLGTLMVIWMGAVIVCGVVLEQNLLYSLTSYLLVFEFFFDLFDGDKSANFEKSFSYNKKVFWISTALLGVFLIFMLLAVFV